MYTHGVLLGRLDTEGSLSRVRGDALEQRLLNVSGLSAMVLIHLNGSRTQRILHMRTPGARKSADPNLNADSGQLGMAAEVLVA